MRKDQPLHRCRRLLIEAHDGLGHRGRSRLFGLLGARDPRGDQRMAWHAKEVVCSIYEHHDPELALEFVERHGRDLQDESCPTGVRSLGRTILPLEGPDRCLAPGAGEQRPTGRAEVISHKVGRAASDTSP